MHFAIVGIIVLISVGSLVMILRNFRKQRDFEGTGRIPPEDYD